MPKTTSSSSRFEANGLPLLIGSLPVNDVREALALILESTPAIPLWPQLPANPLEGMLVQFNEGLPGIVEEPGKTFFDTSLPGFEDEQLRFYEEYLTVSENPALLAGSRFRVSAGRAAGLYGLHDLVASRNNGAVALKGQITGPFTMLTGITDRAKRLGYYDPTVRDLVVKTVAMKAAWQVGFLKEAAPLPVILFLDEPALAGLGSSAFISIGLNDIGADLAESVAAIHHAGGLAGVHVCANTDWMLLLDSELDIISFDAHGFFDRFATCRGAIHRYLDRGGMIAWGIVPTGNRELVEKESVESLVALWEKQAAQLAGNAYDLPALLRRTFITPSCGTGALDLETARRVLFLTSEVSFVLRRKYLPE